MRHAKLDKIDRKILMELQKNGRITNVELAKNSGISAPPCLRRVRNLEETGYIRGYYAQIDPALMGYGVTVFSHVKLTSQSEKDLKAFEAFCKASPLVRECYMLAGEVDFILKVVAKDWDEYQQFLTNELVSAPSVTSVKSSLAMKTSKQEPGVPIGI